MPSGMHNASNTTVSSLRLCCKIPYSGGGETIGAAYGVTHTAEYISIQARRIVSEGFFMFDNN